MADKTIGDLTQAESIGSEDLFVLEQGGEAKKLKGARLVKYAQDTVSAQVTAATEAAENAAAAKTGAESAQTEAQAAQASAESAKTAAETAKETAVSASEAAQSAIDTVEAAKTAAQTAAQTATEKATAAESAKQAAQTAQGAAEAAKADAVTSSNTATRKATEASQSAQEAAFDKQAAAESAASAEEARQAIENMLVEAITLEAGQSATVGKSLVDGVVKLVFGLPAGAKGATGEPGSSIQTIQRTSGNGSPGTTDTYTITMTDGTTSTFTVYNGADGVGSGDMKASVYDPQGKAQDIFAYVEGLAAAAKAKLFSVTIPASGWSGNAQTVSNDMLKAAGFGYIYNPDEASYGAYVSAIVRCGEVTVDGQVTFYCDDTPTDDITVDFMRIEVNDNV